MQPKLQPVIATIMLSLLLGNAYAQMDTDSSSYALSLAEAQAIALENNLMVENSEVDVKIMKKRTREILTEGLPKLNGAIQYTHNFQLPVTILPGEVVGQPGEDVEVVFGTEHNMDISAELYQLIVDGRYFIGLKANRTFMALSRKQLQITENDLRYTIADAYYGVLVVEEGYKVLSNNLATLDRVRFGVNEMYKNGFAEQLDIDRLDLQIANLNATLNDMETRVAVSKLVLKYNMGIPLDADITLTESLDALLTENPAELETSSFDPESRLEFQLLNLQYDVRGYDAGQIRAGYYPGLAAFAAYGWNAQRNSFDFFDQDQPWFENGKWGLQLTIPIFDSYKKGFQYQQKKLEQLKIQNNIDNFRRQAVMEVENAKADYLKAMNNYNTQKQSLELAEKIFNTIDKKYQEGLATSLDVAIAEADLTETQTNFINSMYNLLVAKNRMDKALAK